MQNDVIAVADGCLFPLVLRSSPDYKEENAQFMLVGGCHIHGIVEAWAAMDKRDHKVHLGVMK